MYSKEFVGSQHRSPGATRDKIHHGSSELNTSDANQQASPNAGSIFGSVFHALVEDSLLPSSELHVKPKLDHVTILHDVVLAF